MTTFPTASIVSRALNRDLDIITSPRGYQVKQGLKNITGPTIHVRAHYTDERNAKKAGLIARLLKEAGWDVTVADGSSIIYVNHVPKKTEAVAL
jgi:hypothetical protein